MNECITIFEYSDIDTSTTTQQLELSTSTQVCNSATNYYINYGIDLIIIFCVAFIIIKIIK